MQSWVAIPKVFNLIEKSTHVPKMNNIFFLRLIHLLRPHPPAFDLIDWLLLLPL